MLAGITVPSEEEITAFASYFKNLNLELILAVLVLFVICLVVMKVLLFLLDRSFRRLGVEKSLRAFIRSALRIILWLITLCVVLGFVGVPMTSLVAVLGVVGLALSLAIQGTLSNLAGGIMLLVSKPFKANDFIEAGTVSGKVVEIGLVYTKMCTFDNKVISIPNGQISSEKIINYTTEEQRRVDLKFTVSYADKPEQVISCIEKVVGAHPKALFTPAPFVRLSGFHESSVEYTVRVWCATEDYWDLYYDLLEQVKAAFDRAEIEQTYPHLNVHMIEK